ncbi:MAG: alpha/beta fold hydrolase [Thermoleophilia bacterium]
MTFTPLHRGGAGTPLVLLHGFTDTWRTWELVLPALERRHDVIAPTLVGHAGGPPLVGPVHDGIAADQVERLLDEAGIETAHVAGNSLGGYVALQLAARGRARSVVALAPAGGWAAGDESYREVLARFPILREQTRLALPHLDAILSKPEGRRAALSLVCEHGDRVPADLIAHLLRGVAACEAVEPLVAHALAAGWTVEAERIACPVRVVWGLADQVLPYPRAAARFLDDLLPHADWVLLDDVGHAPQLDAPRETAELILGLAGR